MYKNNTTYTSINISSHASVLPSSIGITVSLSATLVISMKMNIASKAYGRRLALLVLGEFGNFMAYGAAPVTIIVPLQSTIICVNAVIGVFLLHVTIRSRDTIGIIWTVIGVWVLITFAKKEEVLLNGDDIISNLKRPLFLICMSCVMFTIFFLFCWHQNPDRIKAASMFMQIGSVGYVTFLTIKASASMFTLTLTGSNQLTQPVFYIMFIIAMGSAIVQSKLLNKTMDYFDTTMVVPVHYVVYTLSGIFSGSTFNLEYYVLTPMEQYMRLFGTFLLFGGVFFITGGRDEDVQLEVASRRSSRRSNVPVGRSVSYEVMPVQVKDSSIDSTAFLIKSVISNHGNVLPK